jgi:dTMP kinase
MSAAGVFISLEGIEGAGKSTVARALEPQLRARGLDVVLTREPGGTPLAEQVRALVLGHPGEAISPLAETLLMCAARSIHLANLVRPALARGQWVICDRFSDATRAYQGAGRGVDAALIERLLAAVHADLWPRRTLLLDLPVPLGLARVQARRGPQDRFEDEDRQFFESEPQRIRVIDATAAAEAVADRALEALADLLPGARSAA